MNTPVTAVPPSELAVTLGLLGLTFGLLLAFLTSSHVRARLADSTDSDVEWE